MSYIEKHLLSDENIIFTTNVSWVIFLKVLLYTFIALIVNLKLAIAVFIILMIPNLLNYIFSEFATTNKRVVIKTGILARNTFEINKNHLESVIIDQSFIGRIFNYGTVIIIGTGGSKEIFTMVSKPLLLRKNALEFT